MVELKDWRKSKDEIKINPKLKEKVRQRKNLFYNNHTLALVREFNELSTKQNYLNTLVDSLPILLLQITTILSHNRYIND